MKALDRLLPLIQNETLKIWKKKRFFVIVLVLLILIPIFTYAQLRIAETNKILGTAVTIPVDGVCVRVSAMRCHSQALTIKLTRDVPLDEIADVLGSANEWVRLTP